MCASKNDFIKKSARVTAVFITQSARATADFMNKSALATADSVLGHLESFYV
jgi:hypothetical protein